MTVLRLPTVSVINAHTIPTFMVGNRHAVVISADEMVTHSVADADYNSRCCSEHRNPLLDVLYSADTHVDTLMTIIGLATAGVVLCSWTRVTIHVLLNETVFAELAGYWKAKFKSGGGNRCQG
jgi:hypothetical protein